MPEYCSFEPKCKRWVPKGRGWKCSETFGADTIMNTLTCEIVGKQIQWKIVQTSFRCQIHQNKNLWEKLMCAFTKCIPMAGIAEQQSLVHAKNLGNVDSRAHIKFYCGYRLTNNLRSKFEPFCKANTQSEENKSLLFPAMATFSELTLVD